MSNCDPAHLGLPSLQRSIPVTIVEMGTKCLSRADFVPINKVNQQPVKCEQHFSAV